MTNEQIKAIIQSHNAGAVASYKRYQRYYEGNNVTIQDKEIQTEPDNRKAMPFGRKSVNGVVGFMFADVTWEYEDENNETIKMLNSEKGKLKESHSAEIACTKGLSYKIFWQENKELRWAVVPPDNIIVKWSDDIEPEMVEVYYYTEKEDFNEKGIKVKTIRFWRYSAEDYELWTSTDGGDFVIKEEPKPNPAKMVNVVEHYINPEKRNLFYHVIDLMDLMDETLSGNMANEIQTISNAILLMSKILDDTMVDEKTGETDRSKFEKAATKILDDMNKDQGDYAEWLTKTVQWEGIFGTYDRVYKAIWEFLEVPNWTDERYANAASGRALQIMLIPFENKAKMIEKNYKQGLMDEIKIINAFPTTDKIDPEKVKIDFVRNMPFDEEKKIDNAMKIASFTDAETAVKYIGTDILPEQEEILKRLQEKLKEEIKSLIDNTQNINEPQEDVTE